MKLESYIGGTWRAGSGSVRELVNPVTLASIASVAAFDNDLGPVLAMARTRGGGALRAMNFAERGALLRAIADILTANRDRYFVIARENSGNTAADASVDIDGAIFTLKTYARLGQSLGAGHSLIEAGQDQLAREPVFFARHLWHSRPGVAIGINAFNFPAWGMWEKVAVATLAGVPSVAKPATATAMLAHEMVRDVAAASILPLDMLTLICGGGEGLLSSLDPMDSVAFTGSAATAATIRSNPAVLGSGVRINIEADSINSSVIGPDITPDAPLFDLAVREIVKALSLKAGQFCTNIRRVFAPDPLLPVLAEAVAARLEGLQIGDPADEAVRVGPLVNSAQQADALQGIASLSAEAAVISGGQKVPSLQGAFVQPTLLSARDPEGADALHNVEVFGPCATLMGYRSVESAAAMVAKGRGSLAMSLFTNDRSATQALVGALAPWHGRIMVVDDEVGKAHTGHQTVMPQCVHGGPGRAGGGEELGGLRGLRLHMQRTALQGGPGLLEAVSRDAVEAAL